MRTDYDSHDALYRRLRSDGKSGWSSAEDIDALAARVGRMLQHEVVPASGRLLELGCGAGDLLLRLHGPDYELHGVDIAPTAVVWAREKAGTAGIDAEFREGNVLDLQGYGDGMFDVLVDGHCFHCIVGGDRRRFLESSRRVLRPGGALLIATMCGEPGEGWPRDHFEGQSRCIVRDDGVAVRYLGRPEDIVREMAAAGFSVQQQEVVPAVDPGDQDELLIVCARTV